MGLNRVFAPRLLVLLSCFSAALQAQVQSRHDRSVADFLEIRLDLDIDAPAARVSGEATYLFKPRTALHALFLHAEDTRISKARINGSPVAYEKVAGGYVFKSEAPLSSSAVDTLDIHYVAKPKKGMYFLGWRDKRVKPRSRQVWTQGQGIDNRHWFPSYDLQTDKVRFDVTVRFDSNYQVLSNGTLLSEKRLRDGRTQWSYTMRKPMSTYLLAIVIGRYKRKRLRVGNHRLDFYTYPQASDKMAATYWKSAAIFSFFQKELIPFPWSGYAQVPVRDFLYGGMENTTLTVFNQGYVTDFKSFDLKNYVEVNAHELAHQWFGDLVTSTGPKDHWLHEGFASFYSILARKHVMGRDEWLHQWQKVKSQVFLEEKKNPYPVLSAKSGKKAYDKGAYFLHLLRQKMGVENFRVAIRAYLRKYSYKIAGMEDFQGVMQSHSKTDLKRFFTFWLERDTHPVINCDFSRHGRSLRLDFDYTNARTVGLPQTIPLRVYNGDTLLYSKGLTLRGGVRHLRYRMPKNARAVFITLDADMQTLAEIHQHKARAMWVAQLKYGQNFIAKGRALAFLGQAKDRALPTLVNQNLTDRDFYPLWVKAAQLLEAYPNNKDAQAFYARALGHYNGAVRLQALLDAQGYYRSLLPELRQKCSLREPPVLAARALDILMTLDPAHAEDYLNSTQISGDTAPLFHIHWLAWQLLFKRAKGLDTSEEQRALVAFTTRNYDYQIRRLAYSTAVQVQAYNGEMMKNLLRDCLYFNPQLRGDARENFKRWYEKPGFKDCLDRLKKSNAWDAQAKKAVQALGL